MHLASPWPATRQQRRSRREVQTDFGPFDTRLKSAPNRLRT